MSIREQVRALLPSILPSSPEGALSCAEIHAKLGFEVKRATLAFTLSCLAKEEASPFRRDPGTHGYYIHGGGMAPITRDEYQRLLARKELLEGILTEAYSVFEKRIGPGNLRVLLDLGDRARTVIEGEGGAQ